MKRKIYSILTERTLALQAALALTLWASSSFQALAQDDVYVLGGGGGHGAGTNYSYSATDIYTPPLSGYNLDHGNGAKFWDLVGGSLNWIVTAGQGGFHGGTNTMSGGGGGSTFFVGTPSGTSNPDLPNSATNPTNGQNGTAGGSAGADYSDPATPPAPWTVTPTPATAGTASQGGDGGSITAVYAGDLVARNIKIAAGSEGQGSTTLPSNGGLGGSVALTIQGALTVDNVTVGQSAQSAYQRTILNAVKPDTWGSATFIVDSVMTLMESLYIVSGQSPTSTVTVHINTLDVYHGPNTNIDINIEGVNGVLFDTLIVGNKHELTIYQEAAGTTSYYDVKKWIVNDSVLIQHYTTNIDFKGDTMLLIPSGVTTGPLVTAHWGTGGGGQPGIMEFDNNTAILLDLSKASPNNITQGQKVILFRNEGGAFVGDPLSTSTIVVKNGKKWIIDVDTTYAWVLGEEASPVGTSGARQIYAILSGTVFEVDLTPKNPTFPDVTYDKPPVKQEFDVKNDLGGNLPTTSVTVTFDNDYFEIIGDVPQNITPGSVGAFVVSPKELDAGDYTDVMHVTICCQIADLGIDTCTTIDIPLQFTSRRYDIPDLTRHVIIKATDGVSIATDEVSAPSVGIGAYVLSRTDFTFTIVANKETYSLDDATFRVLKSIDLTESDITKTVERLADGSVRVTVHNVNTNITVEVSGISFTANEQIDGLKIYTYDGSLHIAAPEALTVYIYNVQGSLVKTLTVAAGATTVPLPSGTYIVKTVPGASTHTVINK